MKKFWLSLGLTLILVCLGGGGYYGLGTSPSFGQYYNYSNPYDPNGYNNYYSAPQADPLSQLLYYFIPQIQARETTQGEWQYKQQRENERYRKQQLKQQRQYEKQRERDRRERERESRY
jgi:hypothetical protein